MSSWGPPADLAESTSRFAKDPTIADIFMMAYLSFPKHEAGYDLAVGHPAIAGWLARIAAFPGWKAPYDLLPGKRMRCYVAPSDQGIDET